MKLLEGSPDPRLAALAEPPGGKQQALPEPQPQLEPVAFEAVGYTVTRPDVLDMTPVPSRE